MSSESLHVPRELLSQDARLLHHAVTSLKEELDAVDWYRQRAEDIEDAELRELLLHNMREEMEHASMLMEWIRRHNSDFAEHMTTYLFTEAPILGIEKAAEADAAGDTGAKGPSHNEADTSADRRVTIGSLREKR